MWKGESDVALHALHRLKGRGPDRNLSRLRQLHTPACTLFETGIQPRLNNGKIRNIRT